MVSEVEVGARKWNMPGEFPQATAGSSAEVCALFTLHRPMNELPPIDPDVTRARPLPARFYTDSQAFDRTREVFRASWQWLGPGLGAESGARPELLLPDFLAEPLLATRDEAGREHLFPNVCSHRAHPVCVEATRKPRLACGYHGRRFDLTGRCLGAPGFDGVGDFPAERDHLGELAVRRLGGHRFVRVAGDSDVPLLPHAFDLRMNLEALVLATHDPARDRDFEVRAHWALYVENYLEGFHVPYVHPGLHRVLDPADYAVEPFPGGVLQVGRTRRPEEAFGSESPWIGPDEPNPESVGAYYLWWFPNTMWNVYPWGVSVNVVEPLAPDRTRVRFRSFVLDRARLGSGAGGELDAVEAEDEAVVERVQRGIRSSGWRGARYSPTEELGVHAFHRQLVRALA